jgi:hypothetical protein
MHGFRLVGWRRAGVGSWFERFLEYNGWFVDIPGKDVRGNYGSPQSYLHQFVNELVVPLCNVVEL